MNEFTDRYVIPFVWVFVMALSQSVLLLWLGGLWMNWHRAGEYIVGTLGPMSTMSLIFSLSLCLKHSIPQHVGDDPHKARILIVWDEEVLSREEYDRLVGAISKVVSCAGGTLYRVRAIDAKVDKIGGA